MSTQLKWYPPIHDCDNTTEYEVSCNITTNGLDSSRNSLVFNGIVHYSAIIEELSLHMGQLHPGTQILGIGSLGWTGPRTEGKEDTETGAPP